jgi:REP element-mobilizing transposase RayT
MRDYNFRGLGKSPDRLSRSGHPQSETWFVTICARNRECVFGRMEDGRMRLSPSGAVAVETWEEIPERYPGVKLDAFVVMPNHIHGIIRIMPGIDAAARALIHRLPFAGAMVSHCDRLDRQHGSLLLGLVLGYFKATSVERVNRLYTTPGVPLWQRHYYQRPVQDDAELTLMCEYIWNNPEQWDFDRENPGRSRMRAGCELQAAASGPGTRVAV